jgi:hypothetical protein
MPHASRLTKSPILGRNQPPTLGLIGLGTSGSATVGTEIFVEIPTWKNQEQLFTSRRRRLTRRTKQ